MHFPLLHSFTHFTHFTHSTPSLLTALTSLAPLAPLLHHSLHSHAQDHARAVVDALVLSPAKAATEAPPPAAKGTTRRLIAAAADGTRATAAAVTTTDADTGASAGADAGAGANTLRKAPPTAPVVAGPKVPDKIAAAREESLRNAFKDVTFADVVEETVSNTRVAVSG